MESQSDHGAGEVRDCHGVNCAIHFKKIQRHMTPWDAYEEKRLLLGQASGTKNCLKMLKGKALAVSQPNLDRLVTNEAKFEKEAADLEVGDISDTDLNISPLILPSPYVYQSLLLGLIQFGSNVNLLDPATASSLQNPSHSHGSDTRRQSFYGELSDPQ